ncbi:hypothetical protein SprV_0301179400 [Sparganum proliferum]
MRLSLSLLGRFIAWRRVPGSLWGGKHRKIPRLTGARKAAFMDELLLTQQNERYLSKPYLSAEAEATTLAVEQARELAAEDQVFYKTDDLLVASSTSKGHTAYLTTFDRPQQFGVVLNPSKCVFGVLLLEFHGHLVGSSSIHSHPSKVVVILEFPPPTPKHQLQRFLGMTNFCSCFLPNCAGTNLPLTNLLSRPKVSLELSTDALAALDSV